MIDDPPVLRLRRRFERPTSGQLAALADCPTGYLVDCMDGQGALDYRIKPLLTIPTRVAGIALPCQCGPADNLGALGALAIAQPGDIILASTGPYYETAVVGDLVLQMMKNAGVVAFITDGLARDLDGIEEVGLPIYCKGLTPNSPARNGPATAGYPVSLDSVHVSPGDVVVADRDGAVVVPLSLVDQVLERLPAIIKAEKEITAKVNDGLVIPPFYEALVAAGKVVEED
jgi:4-hydroxy-4-methyl-2-oxoglutarate aldolase